MKQLLGLLTAQTDFDAKAPIKGHLTLPLSTFARRTASSTNS